jgi:hypothetical protein
VQTRQKGSHPRHHGVQPMQAYGSSALGTTYQTAARMRSNLVTAVYGRKAQPCPASLIHAQLRPKNDPVIRIATKAINDWAHLWRNAKPSTQTLLRTAWTQCLHDHHAHTNDLPIVGPITGTIGWVSFVGWKPALPNVWTDPSDPSDLRAAILGNSLSEDTLIQKDFAKATTNRVWCIAADHFGGKGLEEGTPDFKPAHDAQHKLRTLDMWAQCSALEGVNHGTAWPNTRLHPTDTPSQGCPRCNDPAETPWHRYWACPHNADIPDEHGFITSSEFLRKVITENPILYPPCLWARAILPYHLTGAHIPTQRSRPTPGRHPRAPHPPFHPHPRLHRRRWPKSARPPCRAQSRKRSLSHRSGRRRLDPRHRHFPHPRPQGTNCAAR